MDAHDIKIEDAFYFPKPKSIYKELPNPFGMMAEGIMKAWGWNGLFVIASVAVYGDGNQWLHVSVSRAARMPTYQELKMIKNDFIGNRKAIFIFPKKERFINIHPHCMHLWCCEKDVLPDFDCGLGAI